MNTHQLFDLARDCGVYILKDSNSGFKLSDLSDSLSMYWCEGITHSVHAWKSLSQSSILICTLPWHHTEEMFIRAKTFLEAVNPHLTPEDFVILCNASDEIESAKKAGWENACLCSANAWLDERVFTIAHKDEAQREYDLVINCRPEKWKRPYIANGISRLAIIKGHNFRKHDYYDLHQLNSAYINEERLSLEGVVNVLSISKVGGIFSAVEGGCYSSSEYLLCGLPVISTSSLGGRDTYYTSLNSRIIGPDESECRDALADLLQCIITEPGLREQIRADHLSLSDRLRKNAYTMIDKVLERNGIMPLGRKIIKSNYRHKMTRYTKCIE